MSEYNLQPSYPNVSVLTTNDKAISVMYGRVPITGEIVPLLVDATGALATSSPPIGAAGGDLGGTYPNPTVTSVADVTTGVLSVANGGTGNTSGTATFDAALTGDVTSIGNATTLASIPAISGAALTNLTPANISAGTAGISITGNADTVTTNANLTGDVTSTGNATTVASVGGETAAEIASTVDTVNAAAVSNTASTLVLRDASGNFAAGTITANLTGVASVATSSLSTDALNTTAIPVNVSGATAPTTPFGQVLTATSATTADWLMPSGGGSTVVSILSTGNTPATGINETATIPGLLTTDTLIAVTQITVGGSGTQPLLYISGLTGLHPTVAGQIGINFVADPGAGTVVLVSVLR